MTKIKRILTLIICVAILASATVIGTSTASASGSGAGLVSWAYRAYSEHWKYVWGGASVGSVDCSGLIYSYAGGERVTESMIAASPESGSIGSIPRIHGLGLYQYGHVGVYVGGGMGIDARDEISNVCLDSISNKSWTQWFKISGVSYPTSGWQEVAGQYYYYEDGQYIVNTSRTIDGVTYSFGSDGASNKTPSNMSSTADSSSSNKKHKKKKTAWQLGDSGSQVTKIQKRLKELGFYNGDITGYFGTDTQKAYKAFQTAAGVVVDGICGKTDRDILYSNNAPVYVAPTTVAKKKTTTKKQSTKKTTTKTKKQEKVISVGDYSKDVTSIQNQLIKLNYLEKGNATGYFGEDTEQAIKDFQDYNEITVTGSVDSATKKALFSKNAVANPEANTEEKTEDNNEEKQLATFTFKDATEEPTTIAEPISTTDETTNKSVVLESNQLASKALAGVTSSESFEQVTPITNESSSQLIKWLCVVIAVMGSVFVLVTINEKKKARRRRRMRHARRMR